MNFTEKDKELVRKFINIKKRGLYVDSMQLTEAYNRILDKNVRNTTCGSCMRARIAELESALNKWEADEAKQAEIKAQEALKEEAPTPIKEEAKEEPTEPKKRGRRPKKEKEE